MANRHGLIAGATGTGKQFPAGTGGDIFSGRSTLFHGGHERRPLGISQAGKMNGFIEALR